MGEFSCAYISKKKKKWVGKIASSDLNQFKELETTDG